MKRYIYYFIIIILTICGKNVSAKTFDEHVQKYLDMSSDELMKKANYYVSERNVPDSALLCYTIVSNRYSKEMSKKDKMLCVDANIGKWYVYFFTHFDYNKSYESLVKAKDIAFSINAKVAQINMNFGCMYQTIAEQSKDKQLYSTAYTYFVEAIENAVKENNEQTLNISVTNILSVANDLDSLEKVDDIWKSYVKYPFKEKQPLIEFNKLLYKAFNYTREKKYDEALKCYDRQIQITQNLSGYVRFLFISYLKKAEIYISTKKFAETEELLGTMLKISEDLDMKDARLIVYDLYTKLYKANGDYRNVEENRDKYFTLKDSLLNYRQISSMNETHFLNEITNIDEKFQRLKIQNDFQTKVFYLESFILIIIIAFAFVFFFKNRQLKKTNRELYNKNVLLLKSEDESKAICKKYKETNPDIHEEVSTPTKDNVELDEEEKTLLDCILKIMEDVEMICSFNFTIEKLSTLAGSKQRLVSELISKVYDCNFNSFLGEYRIKEACRRFEDVANYGNLTIEGIGNSVGFKSRSNFVITFKKFTGLTPSKYKQMAEM